MTFIFNHPAVFFLLVCMLLFAGGRLGLYFHRKYLTAVLSEQVSFKTIESSILGLLALLLGFSFAMAVNRYDLRQALEVDEANAIGTVWLRISTLQDADQAPARQLLKNYGAIRLGFFAAGIDSSALAANAAQAGAIQDELWKLAASNAAQHHDSIGGLFLTAMNDVFDFSEKRAAALENRIPSAAWVLLLLIAFSASALVGIGINLKGGVLLLVLPLIVAAAMTLILDLDSPRSGFVRVPQHSMLRIVAQMNAAR